MFSLSYFLLFYWMKILTCVTIWGVLQPERRCVFWHGQTFLDWDLWCHLLEGPCWQTVIGRFSRLCKDILMVQERNTNEGKKKIIKITAWSVWRGVWTSESAAPWLAWWCHNSGCRSSHSHSCWSPQSWLLSVIPQCQIGSRWIVHRGKVKPRNDFKECLVFF